MYSHPDFPKVDIQQVISELRDNIKENWIWLLVNPPWLYKRIGDLTRKRKRGQPVSFTDFFGYLIGDTILKGVSVLSIRESFNMPYYSIIGRSEIDANSIYQIWRDYKALDPLLWN